MALTPAIVKTKPTRFQHGTGHKLAEVPGPDPVPEMMPKQGDSSIVTGDWSPLIGMNPDTLAHWYLRGVMTYNTRSGSKMRI